MKKLIIGLLIFLCIFTVVAISVTYLSIENINEKNKLKIENSESDKEKNTENIYIKTEKCIDLYGTYDQNDLMINELVEDYNGVKIKIPKIEGLKNNKVQDKINDELYRRFYELVNKYQKVNYANFYTRANFANVISISFHVADENNNEQLYLNYNLVDGEELKLENLFIKGADIKEIVRNAFYKELSRQNVYGEDAQIHGDDNIVFPDEIKLYKAVKGYMDNEDKVFSFTPSEICFYYEDYVACAKMVDIYDKISIYSKYLTDESLYIRDDIGYKNIFTCATGTYDAFEKIEYEYLGDNFWYDLTVWNSFYEDDIENERLDKFNKLKENVYTEIYGKIDEYREIAKNNPNKFYIILSKPNVDMYFNSKRIDNRWINTYSNMATIYKNIEILEMPIEFFEKVYKDKLIEAYRYEYFVMNGGVYLYGIEDEEEISNTTDRGVVLYNYITGEEIKNVEDIFYEDSNYIEVIKSKVKENLIRKYNYLEDEASKLVENINYELDGTQVNVTIPELENFMVIIYFNEFDVSMMKIFEA